MKHMVITIGCEYGAGGPEIGKMLAQAALYDVALAPPGALGGQREIALEFWFEPDRKRHHASPGK